MDKELQLQETKQWIVDFLTAHSDNGTKWCSLKYLAASKSITTVTGPLGQALQELHQERKIKQRINGLEFEYTSQPDQE